MRLRFAAAVTLGSAAVPLWGQQEDLQNLFSEMLDVRVVNVEVVVTDRRGNRIRGLQDSDFELLVDREPVPISYFTEVDDGHGRDSFDDGVGRAPSVVDDEPVGTSYLIFIDDLHAVRQHRDRVLSRLEQDLVLLNPADRVAVVAFDGSTISLLVDWTDSPSRIEQALARARQRKPRGLPWRVDLAYRTDQTRRAVMAATATVRSFANAPGRKVMLLLAEGWREPHLRYGLGASLESLYSPLVHTANLVGYSIYPIDLPGLRPSPEHELVRARSVRDWMRQGTSEFHSPSDRHSSEQSGSSFRYYHWYTSPNWLVERKHRESAEHRVLRYLASQTGGQPMINSYRDRVLGEVAADTRSFYSLGFEAPRDGDDALHRIKVGLPGYRGLRVRAREHYLDLSRSTELSMLVEGSLLFGGSPGADTLEVRFGPPRKAGLRTVAVPVEITIPLDDLTLLPMNGGWMTELELRVALMNRFGRLTRTPPRKLAMHRIDKPAPGDVFVYETELRMRGPGYRYVAAVHEPISGTILSASGGVERDTESSVPAQVLAEASRPTNCSPGKDVLEVCLGAPSKAGFGKISLPMKVRIPLGDLTLLATDGRWMNDLEFRMTMTNEQGDRFRKRVSKIPIRGSRAPRPGDYFVYETDLRVRNRQKRYIAEIYDPLSDTTLSTSGALATPAEPDAWTEGAR